MDSEGWRWITTVGEIVPVGRDSKDETRGPSRFPKRTFFDARSAEESDETKTSATEKNKTQICNKYTDTTQNYCIILI